MLTRANSDFVNGLLWTARVGSVIFLVAIFGKFAGDQVSEAYYAHQRFLEGNKRGFIGCENGGVAIRNMDFEMSGMPADTYAISFGSPSAKALVTINEDICKPS
jgi:hypothetical protein